MQNSSSSSPVKNVAQQGFDPWLLWIAFRRHWGVIIPLGFLLATAAGFVVAYSFEPEYLATHVLEANRDYVLAQAVNNTSRDLAKSEKQLITHAVVLDPVLANPKLRAAPSLSDPLTAERQIRQRLSIGNAGTDNLLTVSYRDKDPRMAAMVCNAIVESYLKIRQNRDNQRLGDIEQWLTIPIENWKRQVANKRQEVTERTKEAQGYDPFKENGPVATDASKLLELRGTLAELEAQEIVIQARLKLLSEITDDESLEAFQPDPLAIQPYVDADRDVQAVRARLVDLQRTIRNIELHEAQGFNQGRFNRLKAEAEDAQIELADAEQAARTKGLEQLAKLNKKRTDADIQQQIQTLNLELGDLQVRRQAFQEDYDNEKSRIESLGGETAEIFFAREDYERSAEILGQLNYRLAVLQTERGRSGSVQTMAEAKAPSWPIEEIPFKKIGIAALGGMMLPFVLAVLLEFRLKRLTNANSLESNNLAPVVGEIARIPGGVRTNRSHRLFEESVDALRANMLFKLEGVRTIVVTSSMPSEGKSSVASQLAISLAKASGETVLLIDADLRSPDQHELFGMPVDPGLTKVLSGRATLDEAIDTSLGDLVHLLPAGRLDSNPHNLLTKSNIEQLFSELKESYQYIIVDTAPILPAAESLAVTSAGDATLLCAMRDVSRTDHVTRTQRRLEASGSRILGTVFSGVPSREYAYRYGDYRYANRQIETEA